MKASRFAWASAVTAVLGAFVASFAPLGTSCEMTTQPGGGETQGQCSGVSTFQGDGAWVLVVVAVPVVLALVPAVVRGRSARIVSAVLLWACCVIGLASIGMFFIPSAVLMTIAATQRESVPLDA